jgi:hypothetical protein
MFNPIADRLLYRPSNALTKVRQILVLFLFVLLARTGVVRGQGLAASLTYPANGAVNADLTLPLQWTAVANVQAYYLYLGTTPGAKDLVDSGEVLQTSYSASNLPLGQTLYVRLWTRVAGAWQYVDSTFSAGTSPSLSAVLTFPADGAVNADLSQPIRWTATPNVQAYYLYVGSTPGGKDLVDSGETLATSYAALNLPAGQTLYARIWTRTLGVWRYVDSTFSAAPAVIARITFPVNGATNADLTQPIRWTAITSVQAYYLYVGSTVGAKDLVDTGEILQTSTLALNLPSGQTLYARLWTRVGNVWRYADSTFTAAPVLTAKMTFPANGAVNADVTHAFQWTAVANVQAYYLYVGTAVGLKDLVDTGEITQTSYLTNNVLPTGQTLYIRLWTRVGSAWRSVDSTFTAAPVLTARITYPANGATNADLTQPVQWTTVANVQAYYLYIGTSLGAKDLVDSNETLQVSWLTSGLPTGQVLYARLWTRVGGAWRYVDSTFTASTSVSLAAVLTYPANGAANIDQTLPATWTSVPNVQTYYLYIGSTVGAKDVIDSQETPLTSFSMKKLPVGITLYARLWTKAGGVWRFRDSTFTASPVTPAFIYPTDGATAVDPAQLARWTPPGNADLHELRVGTSPGASDIFDSGSITNTTVAMTGLPATGAVYAEVLSRVHGAWRHTDIAFTLAATTPVATTVVPADGDSAFDTARPFEWTDVPLARGYRLTIGTTAGASDVHDSGEIHVPQRFVPNLPVRPLFGRLYTKIAGQWSWTDFTFSVAANSIQPALQVKAALWATDFVRRMAVADGTAFSWTELSAALDDTQLRAACYAYAVTLLQVLSEMNVQLQSKRFDITFNSNGYDIHTLVEMFEPVTARWMLLDPTFDLTVQRTSDGTWATAEDISAATLAFHWNDLSYVFLGDDGDAHAVGYYLDYPLLFLNVYHNGQIGTLGQGQSVLPYLAGAPLPVSGTYQFYAAACAPGAQAELLVDGVTQTFACDGVDGVSKIFGAATIAATGQTDPSVIVYSVRRFVF